VKDSAAHCNAVLIFLRNYLGLILGYVGSHSEAFSVEFYNICVAV
jgi:hypothetical protein